MLACLQRCISLQGYASSVTHGKGIDSESSHHDCCKAVCLSVNFYFDYFIIIIIVIIIIIIMIISFSIIFLTYILVWLQKEE